MSAIEIEAKLAGHPFRAFGFTCLLFWPLGFEQFFPIIFLPTYILIFKTFKPAPNIRINFTTSAQSTIIWCFIAFMLIAMLNISEIVRLFTFSKDFLAWICAAILFSIFDAHFQKNDLKKASKSLDIIFWVIISTCIIYVAIGSIQFPSLAYLASPGFIKNSMTGTRFLLKDFGEQLYFYGFTDRVSSFFGSPIHLACVVILLLPFSLIQRKRPIGKVIVYVAAAMCVFFAQARIAIIMIAIYPITIMAIRAFLKPFRSPLSLIILSFFLLMATIFLSIYLANLIEFAEDLLFSRRAGSAEARSAIYLYSWQWIQERPLFGYGTQIDIPGLDYPLGSHSTPLGLAFKYGIPAALLMMFLILSSYTTLLKIFRASRTSKDETFFAYLAASFTCYLAMITINEFVVDLYHHLFLFSLLGAIWGTKRKYFQKYDMTASSLKLK